MKKHRNIWSHIRWKVKDGWRLAGSGHVMDANGWLQVIVQAVESDQSRAQRHVMRGSSGTFRDGWTPEGRRKRGRPRKSWLPWFQFEIREQPNGLSHAEKQNLAKWPAFTSSLHSSVSAESISKPVSAEVFVSSCVWDAGSWKWLLMEKLYTQGRLEKYS